MKRELFLFGAITFLILDVHKDGKYSKTNSEEIKIYG